MSFEAAGAVALAASDMHPPSPQTRLRTPTDASAKPPVATTKAMLAAARLKFTDRIRRRPAGMEAAKSASISLKASSVAVRKGTGRGVTGLATGAGAGSAMGDDATDLKRVGTRTWYTPTPDG